MRLRPAYPVACVQYNEVTRHAFEDIHCILRQQPDHPFYRLTRTYREWEFVWQQDPESLLLQEPSWRSVIWTIVLSALIVSVGKYWMLVRRPIVGIRPLVTVWNMTWFCVNLMGFLRLLPLVVHNLTRYSLSQNVCVHADSLWTSGTTGVWARLWVHFKLWEVLVESVLVVLLKQPCGILQWFNNYAYVLLHGKHLLASRVPGGGIVILTYYGIVAFMNLYCCYMNLHQIPQPKKSTALLDSIYLLQTLSGVVLAITTLHYWKQAMWNHKHCHANEEHIRIMAFAWTGGHVLIGALALIDKQWAATNQAAIEAEAAHRRRRRRKQLQDAKKNNLPAPKTVTFAGAAAEAEQENNKQNATKKKTKQQLVKENGSNHDNNNNTQPNGNNKENVENGNHSDKENAAVNNGHNQKDDKINGVKNGTKKDDTHNKDNKALANGTNGAKTPKPSPAEIQRRIACASPPSSPSRNRVVRASSPSRNGVHVASSPSSHNVSSSMTMIHPHLAAMKGERLPPSSLIPVPEDGTAEDFVRTVLLDVSEKASMDSSSSLLGGNLNDIFAQEQEPVIMQGGKRKRKKKKKNKKKRQNGANTVAAANNHEQQQPVISHQRRRDDNSSSNDSTSAGSGESGTTGSSFGSGSAGSSFESSNTASSASSTSSTDAVVDADGWALSGTDKKKQRKLEKKLKKIEARLIRQLLNEQQQQEEEENEEYEERKRDKNEERKEKMD